MDKFQTFIPGTAQESDVTLGTSFGYFQHFINSQNSTRPSLG